MLMERPDRFWNPYIAGIALGLVLLSAFVISGKGLGASGAANRFGLAIAGAVAPASMENDPQLAAFREGRASILDDWLVFELLGVLLGGFIGAYTAGRFGARVVRGPRMTVAPRLLFALSGGMLMGLAARAARGCTSGQALSGGAVMSAGSWIFMLAVFAGGYGAAWFVRRAWR
jgi:uncharacterized protein